MPKSQFSLDPTLQLDELDAYHQDIVASLHIYFSPADPTFTARFAGKRSEEVASTLKSRLDETDVRSTLAVMTSLEAHFQVDFESRCRKRLKDNLSIYFREVKKTRRHRVRLDEDILEGWKTHTSAPATLISELRSAFRFRHWLAHGRYWELGRKYDFGYVYLMANGLVSGLQFVV